MASEGPLSGGISFAINKPLIPNGKLPGGRGGASVVYADGKIVVFGGHYFVGEGKFEYLDETWLLDVEKLTWHKMLCSGQIPGPRYGHCAHIFGSRMFVFGGKGPNGVVYKDIFFLDLVEWIWVPVNAISRGPSPRFLFASEVVGRKLVVQGGWDGNDIFDDMWIFNTDSFAWLQPRTAGFAPSPRYGHTLTLIPDGRLLIFGGCTMTKETGFAPKYNDDIRQLDTDTMIWTRPRIGGQCPTGRYGHSTILMGSKLVIFGGWGRGGCQTQESVNNARAFSLQVLDVTNMTWYVPRRLGKKPFKHTYNHGAVLAGSSTVLMFGGFDGRQPTNDFVVMNIDSEE